jgi:hypothetical protein
MRAIDSRLSKLEQRFGIVGTAPRYLIILNDRELAHTDDAGLYINILDEAGFLHTAGFGLVDLSQIPRGLSGKEAERFVRENGAKICGRGGAHNPGGPKSEDDQKRSGQSVGIELEKNERARPPSYRSEELT